MLYSASTVFDQKYSILAARANLAKVALDPTNAPILGAAGFCLLSTQFPLPVPFSIDSFQ
jgi:hypothetical protein